MFCALFSNAERAAKVSHAKLNLVALGREAGVFSSSKIAALEWIEALRWVALPIA